MDASVHRRTIPLAPHRGQAGSGSRPVQSKTGSESLPCSRQALVEVTQRLVKEFGTDQSAGSVIRCVARCRDELLRLGLRAGLLDAVEAMARRRLQERSGCSEVEIPTSSVGQGLVIDLAPLPSH